jgi:hypothetical protein
MGKGVLRAVSNVNDILAPKLLGLDPTQQTTTDQVKSYYYLCFYVIFFFTHKIALGTNFHNDRCK